MHKGNEVADAGKVLLWLIMFFGTWFLVDPLLAAGMWFLVAFLSLVAWTAKAIRS